MKVIYSYIPYSQNSAGSDNYIQKELAYIFLLSVLNSNELYNHTELYTNEKQKLFFKKLGIPISKIDTQVLKHEKATCASIPKIRTYMAQKQKYIHLDLDTVLFTHLQHSSHSPVIFAHKDLYKPLNSFNELKSIHNSYIQPLIEAEAINKLDNWYLENYNHSELPNMNIVMVNEPEIMGQASSNAYNSYLKIRSIIDKEYLRFCLPEQGFIHLELKNLSTLYRNAVECNSHVINLKQTTSIDFLKSPNEFPFWVNSNLYYSEKHFIGEMEHLKQISNFNFGGAAHFLGDLKFNPYVICIILIKLKYLKKENHIYQIFETYKDLYGEGLSEGEKLYEQVTGCKINKLI